MSEITAKILRDFNDFPTQIDLTLRGRRYKVSYDGELIKIPSNLPGELYQVLKLVYPFSEKKTKLYNEGELIYSSVIVTGGAGGTTTVMYTVPAKKKLYIMHANLCTSRTGAAVDVWGALYIANPFSAADPPDLLEHYWTYIAKEETDDHVPEINIGFPSAFRVELWSGALTRTAASFFGVLKDE